MQANKTVSATQPRTVFDCSEASRSPLSKGSGVPFDSALDVPLDVFVGKIFGSVGRLRAKDFDI